MPRGLIDPALLTEIADAIRAKNGSSDTYTPAEMAEAIADITTGDNIDHADIPDYVKAEAMETAARVRPHLQSDSIVFIAGSDAHQDDTSSDIVSGNIHAGMAMKALAYALPLDFACYLGDYTWGSSSTTISEGLNHIAEINADIDEAFRGLPQFRCVGNHDPLGYSYSQNGVSLSPEQLYALIGKYNADSGAIMGSTTGGYCYRDFSAKNIRVICLNTAETDTNGVSPPHANAEGVTDAQKKWFADTLISTPQGYGVLVIAHHPLDWGNIMIMSMILRGYAEEQSDVGLYSGVTYDFTGKNKSAFILQIHGHTHTFTVDSLHYNSGGSGIAYGVQRASIPNMCFTRNNEYGRNSGTEYYGIEFGTETTYSKNAGGGKDTALCVGVLNPSDGKLYLVCYGAGIDREVGIDGTIYHQITQNLSHAVSSNNSIAVEDGLSYTAEITPEQDHDIVALTVTMGGVDVTSQVVTMQELYTIKNKLTNVSTSNATKKVSSGSAYSAVLTADSGFAIDSVIITMGGNDVSQYYSSGTINIPSVTGDLVITAVAVEQAAYENQVLNAVTATTNDIFNNGLGYKNGVYISSSAANTQNDSSDANAVSTGFIPFTIPEIGLPSTIYIKGITLNTTAGHTRMQFSKNDSIKTYYALYIQGGSASHPWTKYWNIETLGTQYYKLTPIANGNTSELIAANTSLALKDAAYIRFSFAGGATGDNLIISFDDPIE